MWFFIIVSLLVVFSTGPSFESLVAANNGAFVWPFIVVFAHVCNEIRLLGKTSHTSINATFVRFFAAVRALVHLQVIRTSGNHFAANIAGWIWHTGFLEWSSPTPCI